MRGLKLEALVRDHLGRAVDAPAEPFAPGAALVVDGVAWMLVEDDPARSLGPALAWARRRGALTVNVMAERDTETLARRAAEFRDDVTVWRVDGRRLVPAVAGALAPPPPAAPTHLALVAAIEAGGAVARVEHGVVFGEVRGLEVCRVVDDATTGHVRLEVGVGAHDREAFAMVHGDVPTVEALAGVVAAVGEHRRVGSSQHPLSRIAPERLLRWALEQDPDVLGLRRLVAAQPPVPRPNLRDRVPCCARGERPDGRPVVVVCSVGVDLDVVPYATDARRAGGGPGGHDAPVETLVVVPPRDLVPVTAELAAALVHPVTLVPWSPG